MTRGTALHVSKWDNSHAMNDSEFDLLRWIMKKHVSGIKTTIFPRRFAIANIQIANLERANMGLSLQLALTIMSCLASQSSSIGLADKIQVLAQEASPNCATIIRDSKVPGIALENIPIVDVRIDAVGVQRPMQECQLNILWLTDLKDVLTILDPSILKRAHTKYLWILPQRGYDGTIPKFFKKVLNLVVIDPISSKVRLTAF